MSVESGKIHMYIHSAPGLYSRYKTKPNGKERNEVAGLPGWMFSVHNRNHNRMYAMTIHNCTIEQYMQ